MGTLDYHRGYFIGSFWFIVDWQWKFKIFFIAAVLLSYIGEYMYRGVERRRIQVEMFHLFAHTYNMNKYLYNDHIKNPYRENAKYCLILNGKFMCFICHEE